MKLYTLDLANASPVILLCLQEGPSSCKIMVKWNNKLTTSRRLSPQPPRHWQGSIKRFFDKYLAPLADTSQPELSYFTVISIRSHNKNNVYIRKPLIEFPISIFVHIVQSIVGLTNFP